MYNFIYTIGLRLGRDIMDRIAPRFLLFSSLILQRGSTYSQ